MGIKGNLFGSLATFWSELLTEPRQVGSVFPSSRFLASAVVKEVLKGPPSQVLELGAGTGVITEQLVKARLYLQGLVLVEKSPRFAKILKEKYPEVAVNTCCISELDDVGFKPDLPLTIVSSIPFRSLSERDVDLLRAKIEGLSECYPLFRMIQYSYFSKPPFPAPKSCSWKRAGFVFRNIPPAVVWVLVLTRQSNINPAIQ